MEISSFSGNSVVSQDVFLETVWWEDVWLKQANEMAYDVLLESMLERACGVIQI